ncbi:MAG: D-alanyl-lipoteichoic acid biosynthesis protein DltD, partial [Nitrospirales bacterium]|nr:D-alanyl-lipoteichoic acid biosynthesis protein DltD [Nitrospirales bacterium]
MFKHLLFLICVVAISYGTGMGTLQFIENYLDSKNANTYYDTFGDEASLEKTRHLELQKRSFSSPDNFTVYGSCELEDEDIHVIFSNKNNGFQVNTIGVGGTQSIIHAMNLGAIHDNIEGKKIVFIATVNWFKEGGIKRQYFTGNFSKVKYFSFLFNPRLSDSLKKRLAKRILSVPKEKEVNYDIEKFYARLYLLENRRSGILRSIVDPFYRLYYKLSIVEDKYFAYKKLQEYRKKGLPEVIKPVLENHDWAKVKSIGGEKEKAISNNEFNIRDRAYEHMKARLLEEHRFIYPPDSPEREDFLIFLEVCKELGVRPLIVYFPNHGKIFDYYVQKFQLE